MKVIALILVFVGVPILIGVWIWSGPDDEAVPEPTPRREDGDGAVMTPSVVATSPAPAAEPDEAPANRSVPSQAPDRTTQSEASSEAKAGRMLHDLLIRQSSAEAMRGWDKLDETARKLVIVELRGKLHGRADRYDAAVALWRVTGETAAPIEVLLDGFDREPRTMGGNSWQYLCGLLSEMGPDAAGAVPGLIEFYDTREWRPAEADWIFYAFAKVGPAAKEALPLIREAVDHEHPKINTNAAYALWAVSGEYAKPVDVLKVSLEVRDGNVRRWAAGYLGEIGPKASAALPLLEAAMISEERFYRGLYNRVPAAAAHWRITGRTERALPVLIAGLSGNDHSVLPAARALTEMGPKAKKALPALRRAAKRKSGEIRRIVELAMAAIEGD